jgi:hypothetical protein
MLVVESKRSTSPTRRLLHVCCMNDALSGSAMSDYG